MASTHFRCAVISTLTPITVSASAVARETAGLKKRRTDECVQVAKAEDLGLP